MKKQELNLGNLTLNTMNCCLLQKFCSTNKINVGKKDLNHNTESRDVESAVSRR